MVSSLLVKAKLFQEELRTIRNFYPNGEFGRLDLAFKMLYLCQNPYRISRKFLTKRGEEETHLYGETPLITMQKIAIKAGLKSGEFGLELGSGRGRTCFFLSHFFKCSMVGIEQIPSFVKKANRLAKRLCDKASFFQMDMLDVDYGIYDFVYLYGTCLEDDYIHRLCDKLKKTKKEVRIVSVSYPLSDYSSAFTTKESFLVHYPWGETKAYVNVRKK